MKKSVWCEHLDLSSKYTMVKYYVLIVRCFSACKPGSVQSVASTALIRNLLAQPAKKDQQLVKRSLLENRFPCEQPDNPAVFFEIIS